MNNQSSWFSFFSLTHINDARICPSLRMTLSKVKRRADACHQAYDSNKFTYWYVPTVTRDNREQQSRFWATYLNRKWTFCILGSRFYPNLRANRLVKTVSDTNLVPSRHVKGPNPALFYDGIFIYCDGEDTSVLYKAAAHIFTRWRSPWLIALPRKTILDMRRFPLQNRRWIDVTSQGTHA